MSFASDLALGFKSIFGNADRTMYDIDDMSTLPAELKKSLQDISAKALATQKRTANGIKLSSSERIITAPNIPIIGSFIATIKKARINSQLRAGIKKAESIGSAVRLETDSVVEGAIKTNPYTNPNGKDTVTTKAAGELKNTPRELGGEERSKRVH